MNNSILLLLVAVAVVITTTTPAAYGQIGGGTAAAPTDIEVIDSESIKQQITRFFASGANLANYTLYENGTAVYTFEYAAPGPSKPGIGTTVEVHVTHRYTSENGYIFNSTGIFTPEGRRLVIETQQ